MDKFPDSPASAIKATAKAEHLNATANEPTGSGHFIPDFCKNVDFHCFPFQGVSP
jgi:hypothetical protein